MFIINVDRIRKHVDTKFLALFDIRIRYRIVNDANITLINNGNPTDWEEVKVILKENFKIYNRVYDWNYNLYGQDYENLRGSRGRFANSVQYQNILDRNSNNFNWTGLDSIRMDPIVTPTEYTLNCSSDVSTSGNLGHIFRKRDDMSMNDGYMETLNNCGNVEKDTINEVDSRNGKIVNGNVNLNIEVEFKDTEILDDCENMGLIFNGETVGTVLEMVDENMKVVTGDEIISDEHLDIMDVNTDEYMDRKINGNIKNLDVMNVNDGILDGNFRMVNGNLIQGITDMGVFEARNRSVEFLDRKYVEIKVIESGYSRRMNKKHGNENMLLEYYNYNLTLGISGKREIYFKTRIKSLTIYYYFKRRRMREKYILNIL